VPASDPKDQRRRLAASVGLGRSAPQGDAGPSGGPSSAHPSARREEGEDFDAASRRAWLR
jgi:hypothetical protein